MALPAVAGLTPTNPPCNVTLAWDASPDPSVTGYRIYWGAASRNYTNFVQVGRTNAATVPAAWGVTSYFAATALADPLESNFSLEVSYTPRSLPSPPTGLQATNVIVRISLLQAPSPTGPWSTYATLGSVATNPGFFRSSVTITPATSASALGVPVLASPKRSAR